MAETVRIRPADLTQGDVRALLDFHLDEAARQAASHVYGIEKLGSPDMRLFEARNGDGSLMGLAGLKILSRDHGEVKSVRTHPHHVRQGVAHALMASITEYARGLGITRLSLETHPTPAYAAARALYFSLGYRYCSAFGEYVDGDMSVFMTRSI